MMMLLYYTHCFLMQRFVYFIKCWAPFAPKLAALGEVGEGGWHCCCVRRTGEGSRGRPVARIPSREALAMNRLDQAHFWTEFTARGLSCRSTCQDQASGTEVRLTRMLDSPKRLTHHM